MTDRTQPEAGSTHIIRFALELGLLWIDGDGRNKVREALDALDALESKLASIGAARAPALSAAPAVPAGWVKRWYGSGGKEFWEGWSILNAANREMIAHLGPDVDPDAVRDIVAAHNEALCGECAGTGGRWCPACAGATPPAEQQAAKVAPAIGDELRDTLVAVSAAIADQDDRAAQAMLREILAAPPADSHPAPVLLSDEELCQIEEPYLLNFRIPLGGQYDFARAVEKAVLAKTYGTQAPQQEPATVPRFNCWSTNEGDSWFDHPADSQAIYDCLGNDAKVGDEYELTAGWKSVTARYRITEVVGDGEEYEVECISHQQENTAPQQEAQEPALFVSAKQLADLVDPSHATGGSYLPARKTRAGLFTQPLYTAPQPAPAPLSFDACDMATAAAQGFRSGQAAAKQEE